MDYPRETLAKLAKIPHSCFWVKQSLLREYCMNPTDNIYERCINDRYVPEGQLGNCVLGYFQEHRGEVVFKLPMTTDYAFFTMLSEENLLRYGKAVLELMGPDVEKELSNVDFLRSGFMLWILHRYGFNFPLEFSYEQALREFGLKKFTSGRYWMVVCHFDYLRETM